MLIIGIIIGVCVSSLIMKRKQKKDYKLQQAYRTGFEAAKSELKILKEA